MTHDIRRPAGLHRSLEQLASRRSRFVNRQIGPQWKFEKPLGAGGGGNYIGLLPEQVDRHEPDSWEIYEEYCLTPNGYEKKLDSSNQPVTYNCWNPTEQTLLRSLDNLFNYVGIWRVCGEPDYNHYCYPLPLEPCIPSEVCPCDSCLEGTTPALVQVKLSGPAMAANGANCGAALCADLYNNTFELRQIPEDGCAYELTWTPGEDCEWYFRVNLNPSGQQVLFYLENNNTQVCCWDARPAPASEQWDCSSGPWQLAWAGAPGAEFANVDCQPTPDNDWSNVNVTVTPIAEDPNAGGLRPVNL